MRSGRATCLKDLPQDEEEEGEEVVDEISFEQPLGLVEESPQPFHSDSLPVGRGAPDFARGEIQGRSDADGETNVKLTKMAGNPLLLPGRPQRDEENVRFRLVDPPDDLGVLRVALVESEGRRQCTGHAKGAPLGLISVRRFLRHTVLSAEKEEGEIFLGGQTTEFRHQVRTRNFRLERTSQDAGSPEKRHAVCQDHRGGVMGRSELWIAFEDQDIVHVGRDDKAFMPGSQVVSNFREAFRHRQVVEQGAADPDFLHIIVARRIQWMSF